MTDPAPAHRFYAAVRRAARRVDLGDYIPELLIRIGLPGLMTRLGVEPLVRMDPSMLRAQKLYHTLLFEHAEELGSVLRTRGVRHFFAKGIGLGARVYQPGDRFIGDVDVYVPVSDREIAIQTLVNLGYRSLPEREQAGPRELRSALALVYAGDSAIDRIGIDLHWGLDPVDRLLPRQDRPIPPVVWDETVTTGRWNTPAPEHHAAILAHHLIHTDLLHVRSLLDLAFVFQEMPEDGGGQFLETCEELRLGGFGSTLARIIGRDFGVCRSNALAGSRPTRVPSWLTLDNWLVMVARANPEDDNRITLARIRRRLRILPWWNLQAIASDVILPPPEFLTWRWGRPLWKARLKHFGQVVRKLTPATK